MTEGTVFEADSTIYAQWTYTGGSSSSGGSSGSSSSNSGTSTTTEKNPDGSTTTTVTDSTGKITEVKTEVPASAAAKNETITLPVEVPSAASAADAPAVQISVPTNAGTVKVEIPTAVITSGTVAVIVKADGTEKVIKI